VSRVAPLSMTTEVEVIENISDDTLSSASISVSFTQVLEKNLREIMHEIKENNKRIRSLEEKVQCYKSDHNIIQEFRACVE
jgi:hypothetical protein